MTDPETITSCDSPDAADRLTRFLGDVDARDAEVMSYWRIASPTEHARAMIELSAYAQQVVAQTGYTKDPNERFPGFQALSKSGGRSPAA